MSLNWREIDLILDELPLAGSHIQKIIQPDFQSLVFQVYSREKRFNLLIHLGQGQTRIHAVESKPDKKVKLQRFAQLLRSRIEGGRILECGQIPGQRIVKFHILRGGESTCLWVRLWGNAANIIATNEEGTIIDAFYRRPNRDEISGGSYDPEKYFSRTELSEKDLRYTVRDYATEKPFNTYIEEVYGNAALEEVLREKRRRALENLDKHRDRLRAQLAGLHTQRGEYEDGDYYKEIGDLITGNIHRLENGARWLSAENYYRNNEPVEIELDPALSPAENAEKYYQKHRKAKKGLAYVQKEIQSLEEELSSLTDISSGTEDSEDIEYLDRIIQKYKEKRKRQTRERDDKTPGLRFVSGDFLLLVGRNARENDELLRRHVQGNDYWLHSRDYPGGYVFVKAKKGKSVPLETLLDGGNLAIHYSKGRSAGGGELYYTQVKYLRRAKHGKLGTVIPTQEKNLSITIDPDRLKRLLNQQSEDYRIQV